VKALIIDIDGVVMQDDQALPGAPDLVKYLLDRGYPFLFLTNFPSQTPADLRNRLLVAGMDVPVDHFYTSAMATAEFLDDQAGDRRKAYVVGEGALIHVLYQAGFTLTDVDADFVVLGETRSYNFEMIQKAAQLIREGARFIATNPDVAGPRGRPSCGAFSAPIERITGKRPFTIGKPNAYMMRAALRHMKAHSEDTWMIGDNMDTDIIAGIQSGMQTVLVLSGVSRQEELPLYAYRPHYIVAGPWELKEVLEAQAGAAV
jgi:NagD protein